MTNKQIALIASWIIIGVAIYFMFLDKILVSLVIMILASFFRGVSYEKGSVQDYINGKRKSVIYAKCYAAIVSFVVFTFTLGAVLTDNQDFLTNHALIGFLIIAILWPFILLGLYHELILFKQYGK